MNTSQARLAYPEFIENLDPLRCNFDGAVAVSFAASDEFWCGGVQGCVNLRVHPATVEAFRALSRTFKQFGYTFREQAGGTLSCRKITGGDNTSLHAHGVALDINPSVNSWGSTSDDYPPGLVQAVKNIRTHKGARVFRWGGDFGTPDPMHWEPTACTRIELSVGIDWSTVPNGPLPTPGGDMTPEADAFWQKVYEDLKAQAPPAEVTSLGNLLEWFRGVKNKIGGGLNPTQVAEKTVTRGEPL